MSARLHVPSRLEGMETFLNQFLDVNKSQVYMCLPVWRESKRYIGDLIRTDMLDSLHVPSRLEGIETR